MRSAAKTLEGCRSGTPGTFGRPAESAVVWQESDR